MLAPMIKSANAILCDIPMIYKASIMLIITHLFEFMWFCCPYDSNIGGLFVDIEFPLKIYSLALYYIKHQQIRYVSNLFYLAS